MPDSDDKIKISELTAALSLDNTDDLVIDQGPAGSRVTKRTSLETLGSHIAEDMSFSSELQTTNKHIIGAINELHNGGGGGGSSTLAGLTDVAISSASNGQVLKYDGTSQKWVNGTGGGSSGDHITLTQAQYDALVQAGTVDPDAFYFISDAVMSAYSHQYSSTEHVIGTWVDGSPVYEKTIYNAGGVTGNFNFQHGISNFGKLLAYEGTVSDSAFSQYGDIWVVPRIASDGNSIGIDKVSATAVYIINPNAFGTRLIDWYITLRYTKTSS